MLCLKSAAIESREESVSYEESELDSGPNFTENASAK